MFLLRSSFFLFICESSSFKLMTHIFLLNFFFLSQFLPWELLMHPFLIDLLSWTEFQYVDDPCLGYFSKKFLLFRLKEGTREFLLMFQDKRTWPYIILNYDCLIFRKINSRNRFQRFQILVIFFIFFSSSYLLLRLPFAVFNLTDFCFLFLLILIFFECL